MKAVLLVALLFSAVSTFASNRTNSINDIKTVLDTVAPHLEAKEEVIIIRKTWAINDVGPNWVVYVYDGTIGNSLIFVTRNMVVTNKIHCPAEDAPEVCSDFSIK